MTRMDTSSQVATKLFTSADLILIYHVHSYACLFLCMLDMALCFPLPVQAKMLDLLPRYRNRSEQSSRSSVRQGQLRF